jgi:hypothetical protein
MQGIKRVYEVCCVARNHRERKREMSIARFVVFWFSPLKARSMLLHVCLLFVIHHIIVIRGLALGTLNDKTRSQFLVREFKMAGALSIILSIAGFCRAIFFQTPFLEAFAVTTALASIVFTSICLGAVLPLVLEFLGIDPAHSSTTIQGMYNGTEHGSTRVRV